MIAVVPVAFFTEHHVEMTARFLTALDTEVDEVRVYHNGGLWADEGAKMLAGVHATVIDATGWPFFRMWNHGLRSARGSACLVLNNDIEWELGALGALGAELDTSEPDVAVVSPSPGGEPRHAFAIRPELAPEIDERYHTWFGDVELEYSLKRDGYRLMHFDPGIRHPHIQTTMDHLPGVQELRRQDEALFVSKWL